MKISPHLKVYVKLPPKDGGSANIRIRRNSLHTFPHATVNFPDLLTGQSTLALLDVCRPFLRTTGQR